MPQEPKEPILNVVFYKTDGGNEPVREWLKSLMREDRKAIGEDIKTAQFGWPLGMPLIRKLETGVWEIRSGTRQGIPRFFSPLKAIPWFCCTALSRSHERPRGAS